MNRHDARVRGARCEVRKTGTGNAGFWRCLSLFFLILFFAGAAEAKISAGDAGQFFQQNCVSCHTIGGGRLTGPDLKDVTGRKDAAWLKNFMRNPKSVIDGGDAYAAGLVKDANGVVMPTVAGMTPEIEAALIILIESESKLPKSRFSGSLISDAPFTRADIERGRRLFTGAARLKNGGPACASCHTAGRVGALGGGTLGPDLTKVFERLKGRAGLGAWLLVPATAVMNPLFKKTPLEIDEISALVAYFESTMKQGATAGGTGALNFFLFGLGGAAFGLALIDVAWRRRLKSVRRVLVEGARAGSDDE